MADNINVTAGTGKTIGADEITSVLYQRVKLIEGADGTNDGDISATNPLPVELRDVDTTLVADVGAIKTSVQTLDNAISGNEMQVDVLTMPTTTVQATDLDVRDLTSTDVVTVTGGAGQTADVKITLDGESVPVTGTFWQATQPVSGTVTANLSATDNAVLDDIAAKDFATQTTLAAINAKLVSGTDIGDVDVTTIVPGTGATNLGKAEDAAHTSADVGVMALGVRTDVPNAVGAGTTGDYSFVATDMAGGLRTALYETDFAVLGTNHVKKYYTNAGAVTDGIVWSPAAGKRWYITDLVINVSAAATVTLEDDKAGGDEAVMKFELAANSGVTHSFNTPLFSGEDAADLIVTTSAGNVYITVTGYEI